MAFVGVVSYVVEKLRQPVPRSSRSPYRNDEKALGAVVTCVINDDNAAEGTSGNTRLREEIAKKSGSHV